MPQGPVNLGFGTTEESFSSPRNRTHAAKQHAFEKCIALLDNKKGYPDGYPFFYLEREPGATRSSGPWLWHDRGEL